MVKEKLTLRKGENSGDINIPSSISEKEGSEICYSEYCREVGMGAGDYNESY